MLHWFVVGLGTTVMSLMMLSKGATLQTLGLISALYSACIVVFEFPSGVLADVAGQKKIYVWSICLSILGYGIIAAANRIPLLCVGFAVAGIARAFSSGSVEALFINTYIQKEGKDRLHRLISVMNSGEIIGLATGALLGGLIPMIWAARFPNQNRYHGNLFMQIVVLFALLFFMIFCVREEAPIDRRMPRLADHVRASMKIAFSNRSILLMVAGSMLWGFTFNAVEVFWQPRLQSILGSDAKTWIFGTINSGYFLASLVGVMFINLILKRKRIQHSALIMLSRMATGLGIAALSFQNRTLPFATVYLLLFMMNGMMTIPEGTILNTLLPPDQRSSLLSFTSLMLQLGGIIGAVLFSRLVGILRIQGIWLLAGIIFSLSGFLYLYVRVPQEQPPSVSS